MKLLENYIITEKALKESSMKVFVLTIDVDATEGINTMVKGVFTTEEKARKAGKEIIDNYMQQDAVTYDIEEMFIE